MMSDTLVIIPARAGSKGIPRKNFREIAGKPLIRHTVDYAISETVDDAGATVCVTTDERGVDRYLPQGVRLIERPAAIASDRSDVIEAVLHALFTFANEFNQKFTNIVLLQPTAPIRRRGDLSNIIQLLNEHPTKSVISVVKVGDEHPARMYRRSSSGEGRPLLGTKAETARRQDLDEIFRRNGCFYGCNTEKLLIDRSFFEGSKILFEMDADWFCNIDEPRDWKMAELMLGEWFEDINS